MADNRVVIKINYDKDKRRKELIDPKMVTVWHTGRIFGAIAILVVTIILIFFWISGDDKPEDNSSGEISVNQVTPEHKDEAAAPISPLSAVPADLEKANRGVSERPTAIILDKRVIRASLNTAPRYGEPGEPVNPQIILASDQSVELFYFSEIKNMKGKVLFHHWLKDGVIAYKKQFTVETDKFKLISSKKMSQKDEGEWQVVLIDSKGKHYSEVNFAINP